METIYEKKTGKALKVEAVDKKEIMAHSDLYSDEEPKGKKHKEATDPVNPNAPLEPKDMTVAQLKAALDLKGVQYNVNAPKNELIDAAVIAEVKG